MLCAITTFFILWKQSVQILFVYAGTGDEGLDFYAVAVVKTADAGININTMKGTKACIPG